MLILVHLYMIHDTRLVGYYLFYLKIKNIYISFSNIIILSQKLTITSIYNVN
jgi:hypothetical protein